MQEETVHLNEAWRQTFYLFFIQPWEVVLWIYFLLNKFATGGTCHVLFFTLIPTGSDNQFQLFSTYILHGTSCILFFEILILDVEFEIVWLQQSTWSLKIWLAFCSNISRLLLATQA